MTLALGITCSDGVVQVTDRKVTRYEEPIIYYDNKVSVKYYPIVVSYAGPTNLCEMFVSSACRIAQEHSLESHIDPKPPKEWSTTVASGAIQTYVAGSYDYQINFYKYIQDTSKLSKQINDQFSAKVGDRFEALIGTQITAKNSLLVHIGEYGKTNDETQFKAIGSSKDLANEIFSQQWDQNMSMNESAALAYSAITSIEKIGLDPKCGVGKGNPQIYFIPKSGQICPPDVNTTSDCQNFANQNFVNIKKILS